MRQGISAEAYGIYNKKSDFVPKISKKTEDQMNRIKASVINSVLFNNLEQKDLNIVINAMEEKFFTSGQIIIQQGDKGDCLYVVEKGNLDCFRNNVKIKSYDSGDSFGELALMYNAPRAATVKASSKCLLWSLDRETFNYIVKESAIKKRERYETFLKQVELMQNVEPYELMQICDAIKSCSYKKGDYVIKEGEMGDIFYIIEDGNAIATKLSKEGKN